MDITDFNFVLFISNYVIPDQSSVFFTSCKLECAFMTDYKGHHSFFYHPDTMECITLPDKIYSTQNLVYDNGFQYWISSVDLCEPNPCSNVWETCFHVEDRFECRCINILDDTIITSPSYPTNYTNDVTTCYLINGRPGQNISLSLDAQYSIEATGECNDPLTTGDVGCEYDYLELQGLRYCGSVPPGPTIIPGGQNTTVRFKTDDTVTCTGFKLNITYTNVDVCEPNPCSNVWETCFHVVGGFECRCMNILDDAIITSPNYPTNYANDVTTCYLINGRPGQNISLSLDAQYSIEATGECNDPLTTGDAGCEYDYLELQGLRYCGSVPPGPIIIPTGDNTTVRFKTDDTVTCTGFKLNITYTSGMYQVMF
ncbi:hypothetical protein SNE40_016296 [Patella caerulea]|uniref:CUB domain-containing protein n=1 Tax=Patella caerulea TaxID=87958 RepID=A0AAN8JD13_PATCE